VFVGDTGRPDLLESAAGVEGAMREGAESLYRSVRHFLDLPDYLQVWPGHGAGSACGKALGSVPETTVGYERRFNPALRAAIEGQDAFLGYVLDAQPEPPPYFGRMKRLNRDGAPVIRGLPHPRTLGATDLDDILTASGVVFVDAREGRAGFMGGHLPGALYMPFDKSFPTVAGSYLREDDHVYLVLDDEHLEEAVRNLVRIGIDEVAGHVTPHALEAWVERGGELRHIPEIDTMEMEARRGADALVLDVRGEAEFRTGHVPGALNIAYTSLPERLGELPRDRTLLVHCATGSRSAVAAALLDREGLHAVHVNGLFARWLVRHGRKAPHPLA
jgi:hydroxyacylglutathione hydrolase